MTSGVDHLIWSVIGSTDQDELLTNNYYDIFYLDVNWLRANTFPRNANFKMTDLPVNQLQGQAESLENIFLDFDVVEFDVAAPY